MALLDVLRKYAVKTICPLLLQPLCQKGTSIALFIRTIAQRNDDNPAIVHKSNKLVVF
jgi:hypothetical protein